MKKIVILIIAISMFSCTKNETAETPEKAFVFSGNIKNLDGGKLSLRNSEKVIKEISINDDGTFLDTIADVKPGYYTFKYANETSGLYLKPNYELNLSLNSKEFDETIKYSGLGSNENNYLAQKYLNQEELGYLMSYKYLGTLEEQVFLHKMDSVKNLNLDFLDKQKNLDEDFKSLEKGDILYSWAKVMHQYPAYKNYINKTTDFEVSSEYPDYIASLDLENEELLELASYRSFLQTYYNKKASVGKNNEGFDQQTAYMTLVSNEVKSEKIKNALLYAEAKYGITYTNDLQAYYDFYMANTTDEEYKNEITSKYDKLIKLSKGAASPLFVDYENFKGGTTSLTDLKGKYVYVDVWATWCGPCKREVPFLKEIEKQYHNKDIEFVSISVDKKKDYDKWRKFVEEEELSGIQLFAPNDWSSQFVTDYSILGIPRFILIDPEGKIINSNAPTPSSGNLTDLFEEYKI